MHMPKQTWSTPVSNLPADERLQLMRESFDAQFPWLSSLRVTSLAAEPAADDSTQRGFLIGSVRL